MLFLQLNFNSLVWYIFFCVKETHSENIYHQINCCDHEPPVKYHLHFMVFVHYTFNYFYYQHNQHELQFDYHLNYKHNQQLSLMLN